MKAKFPAGITRNNTTVTLTPEGATVVTLHRTAIVTVRAGVVTLNSDGWRTVTTKARMNEVSRAWNLGFTVYQDKHEWFVRDADGRSEYYDGYKLEAPHAQIPEAFSPRAAAQAAIAKAAA